MLKARNRFSVMFLRNVNFLRKADNFLVIVLRAVIFLRRLLTDDSFSASVINISN